MLEASNEGTEERKKEGMKEQTNKLTKEQMNKETNGQTNEGTKEQRNERMNEKTNKRTNEKTNKQDFCPTKFSRRCKIPYFRALFTQIWAKINFQQNRAPSLFNIYSPLTSRKMKKGTKE